MKPFPPAAPAAVWLGQALHLALLVGLLLRWRWEAAGSLIVIVAAFAFFVDKAGARFPLFFGVTIVPALLALFCWWQRRRIQPHLPVAPIS